MALPSRKKSQFVLRKANCSFWFRRTSAWPRTVTSIGQSSFFNNSKASKPLRSKLSPKRWKIMKCVRLEPVESDRVPFRKANEYSYKPFYHSCKRLLAACKTLGRGKYSELWISWIRKTTIIQFFAAISLSLFDQENCGEKRKLVELESFNQLLWGVLSSKLGSIPQI